MVDLEVESGTLSSKKGDSMIEEWVAAALLESWPVGALLATTPASSGSINQTLLTTCATGRYALRRYRQSDLSWVAREHALMHYVCANGVPAIEPLPLTNGATILEHQGALYALFPFAPGHQVAEHELTEQHLAVMGAFLARLHTVLRQYPHERVSRREFHVDPSAASAAIERYLAHLRALPTKQPSDHAAYERLHSQQAWIAQHTHVSLDELAALPQQVIHGDYTHTNLFFEKGDVSAIIDWDQSYVAPRAWEVIRTIDLVLGFAPTPTKRFLEGYWRVAALSLAELDVAAHCYGIMRGHDTWMYSAIYDQGNDRVRAFIRPGGFTPIETQWVRARAACL